MKISFRIFISIFIVFTLASCVSPQNEAKQVLYDGWSVYNGIKPGNDPSHFSVLKAFLGPSIGFLLLFLLEHYRIFNFIWLKILVILVFVIFSIYLSGAANMNEVNDRFTVSLIPLELSIVFIMIIMGIALYRHLPQAWIIACGMLVGVVLGSHDVYYQMTGRMPTLFCRAPFHTAISEL